MILGITGITGSGKHIVADFFEKNHWLILDTNKMIINLCRPYTHVWKGITDLFGEKVLNQNDRVNRIRLNKILYNPDDIELSLKYQNELNKLIYPSLEREIRDYIHRHFRRKSNIAVVAPMWEDLNLNEVTDKLIIVRAKADVAFARVKNRDGWTREMYEMHILNQKEPIYVDYKLENNGSEDDLKNRLKTLYDEIKTLRIIS